MKFSACALFLVGPLIAACEYGPMDSDRGEMRRGLVCCERFMNVSWTGGGYWVTTRPMLPGETPTRYFFRSQHRMRGKLDEYSFIESCTPACPTWNQTLGRAHTP